MFNGRCCIQVMVGVAVVNGTGKWGYVYYYSRPLCGCCLLVDVYGISRDEHYWSVGKFCVLFYLKGHEEGVAGSI